MTEVDAVEYVLLVDDETWRRAKAKRTLEVMKGVRDG